jgi:hypothetical protein
MSAHPTTWRTRAIICRQLGTTLSTSAENMDPGPAREEVEYLARHAMERAATWEEHIEQLDLCKEVTS